MTRMNIYAFLDAFWGQKIWSFHKGLNFWILVLTVIVSIQIIVSGGGLVLENGSAAPWNVSQGAILAPSSTSSSLKTAIETAGDMSQISRQYVITGTEFGQKLSPMPRNINLTSTGYNCSVASSYGLSKWLNL